MQGSRQLSFTPDGPPNRKLMNRHRNLSAAVATQQQPHAHGRGSTLLCRAQTNNSSLGLFPAGQQQATVQLPALMLQVSQCVV